MAAESEVNEVFDAIVGADDKKVRTVMVGAQEFTLVDEPAAGALLIMMRRLDDNDGAKQMSAVVRLLEKWIVPEEHERLWEAIEAIKDASDLNAGDLPKIIEAASNRPT